MLDGFLSKHISIVMVFSPWFTMELKSLLLFFFSKLTRKSRFNKKLLRKQLASSDRLNIGCGGNIVENWVNIGLFEIPKALYYSSKITNQAKFVHFDVTSELPINPDSIQYIYASHFIEHLTFPQGLAFLKNCHKVMKRDGIIRLTFPDLELWILKYVENDTEFFKKYSDFTKNKNDLPDLKTKGEIFMSQVHGWGHKWCYDFDSVKDILERTGFSEVTRKKAFQSLIPDIDKLEPNIEQRLFESIFVEAKKLS
jgi:predicted SAM-dependent methyltransferase